ncbi:MAG: hypothetical protein R3195_13605 [Gemmatimonadota bacterium]|nr:hypothetical protein [Gemmatimonadota bacterium]
MSIARRITAVIALVVFAHLILRAVFPAPPLGMGRFETAMLALLVPLTGAAIGVWAIRPWGRWLALGGALAVLPWATALAATPFMDRGAPLAALVASVALLLSLGDRGTARRYEGCGRIPLVSWTIVTNIASILVLYLFASAYDYTIGWHFAATVALLAGLLIGVSRLAAGKTVGIIAVAACALLLIPAIGLFVAREATHPGEVFLLAAVFMPGIVTAGGCVAVFGGPMLRFMRD